MREKYCDKCGDPIPKEEEALINCDEVCERCFNRTKRKNKEDETR